MTSNANLLLAKIEDDLRKAFSHLRYSLLKAHKILSKPSLTEDELESLEGFGPRFARASDIAIQRFLRLKLLDQDPAFRGSVIDLLNSSEKCGWIESAGTWRRIRELRNVTAHEYSEIEARALYGEMAALAPEILKLERALTP